MCIGCLYMLGFTENELFKYIFFGGVMLIATSVLVDSGSFTRKKSLFLVFLFKDGCNLDFFDM